MANTFQNVYGRNEEFPVAEGGVYEFFALGSYVDDDTSREICVPAPNNHEIRFMGVNAAGAPIAIECNVKLESRPTNTTDYKEITTILNVGVNDVWTEVVGEMFKFRLTVSAVTVGAGEFIVITDGAS